MTEMTQERSLLRAPKSSRPRMQAKDTVQEARPRSPQVGEKDSNERQAAAASASTRSRSLGREPLTFGSMGCGGGEQLRDTALRLRSQQAAGPSKAVRYLTQERRPHSRDAERFATQRPLYGDGGATWSSWSPFSAPYREAPRRKAGQTQAAGPCLAAQKTTRDQSDATPEMNDQGTTDLVRHWRR